MIAYVDTHILIYHKMADRGTIKGEKDQINSFS